MRPKALAIIVNHFPRIYGRVKMLTARRLTES